jgi:MFS family permease
MAQALLSGDELMAGRTPAATAACRGMIDPPDARAPSVVPSQQARNFALIQVDSIPVGVLSAAGTFLPVFFVRLGASGAQVGLLTTLPALFAVCFAIPLGRWLQRRRNIVPWYSRLRLLGWAGYAAMALAAALLPPAAALPAMLAVWTLAALPSTAALVAFPIIMDAAAGPRGRYDLLGRRWALMGIATALSVAAAGVLLGLLRFPGNFEWLLVAFTLAGAVSFGLTRRIVIPDQVPASGNRGVSRALGPAGLVRTARSQSAFFAYEARAFVYSAAVGLVTPLLPLYYVHELHASNAWVGLIGAGQAVGLMAGYMLARRVAHRRGGAAVLLPSLLVATLVPGVLAVLDVGPAGAAISTLGGIATAGANLALFDELMQRVPHSVGVTFSSVDQTVQNLAYVVGPLSGGLLAGAVGIRPGLLVAALVTGVSAAMFGLHWRSARPAGG